MISNEGDRTPPSPRDDWALFLDVDGTLTSHVARADAVVLDARVGQLLGALYERLDGALALVTGRSLAALDALFHPAPPARAAGLHGLQVRPAADDTAWASIPASWTAEALEIAGRHPGALIESHGPCLYLHWRAGPTASDDLTAFALRFAAAFPSHRLHVGAHGIEIRPHGMDKGKAIAAFMAQPPFAGRIPVFAGDDPADEPGFEAVNALGGISIRVGAAPRPSAARFTLDNPGDVLAWLAGSGPEQNFKENARE